MASMTRGSIWLGMLSSLFVGGIGFRHVQWRCVGNEILIALAGVPFQKIGEHRFVICGRGRLGWALFSLTLACKEIDPEFVGKIDQVAPGISITTRKLIDEVFDAGYKFRDGPFLVAMMQRDVSAQCIFEQPF